MSALRTEKNATIDAIRSIAECIASVRIATEPVIAPAASLSTIRAEFEAIESAAARVREPGPVRHARQAMPPPPGRRGRGG